MSIYDAFVRRALDGARRLSPGFSRTGRWPLMRGIAVILCVSALGPASPARADPPPDPAARLQIFVKSVHIYDDRDLLGAGDMEWSAGLCSIDEDGRCGPSSQSMYGGNLPFHASSGADVTLNRVVPMSGDSTTPDVTPEAGMPVYAGRSYTFNFHMRDTDFVDGDWMGAVYVPVNAANGWSIGTFTTRSVSFETDTYGDPGNYAVTWEIRRTPLPDLVNRGIRLIESADGQFYCVTVQNVGERPSGLIPLAIRADGALVRATTLPALDVGQTTEHCALRSELPARQLHLSFAVDEGRQTAEMDESNNRYEWGIPATGASIGATAGGDVGAAASPQPKPSGPGAEPSEALADLTVRAIRVNGRVPDGKDDCEGGKNAVTVVVKNAGKGDAGSFTMRLSVDGNDHDTAVDGLDAGQEREARFDNIQLKAGEHTLKAVADPEHVIAEPKEDNNELKVTARCQDTR